MSFSAQAGRLAGLCALSLGWRPEEFWQATPAELASIVHALNGDACGGMDAAALRRLKEMFPDGR